jgi:AcrR family transcriptional regulator
MSTMTLQKKKARPARRRAPRSGEPLTAQRIVDAALALVEEASLAGLTTRRLGERLGCEAMSIYHHFPSKRHLLDALVDHAIGSIELAPAAMAPMERLRHAMYAWRAMANRFPALYPLVAVHRLNTPTGVGMIESVLALIADVVPDAELTARHFRALGYYITGASLDETSGYARGPSAAEPVSDAYIAAHCPRLMACAPFFQPRHWQATYDLGLEALLARVEADALALAGRKRKRRSAS